MMIAAAICRITDSGEPRNRPWFAKDRVSAHGLLFRFTDELKEPTPCDLKHKAHRPRIQAGLGELKELCLRPIRRIDIRIWFAVHAEDNASIFKRGTTGIKRYASDRIS